MSKTCLKFLSIMFCVFCLMFMTTSITYAKSLDDLSGGNSSNVSNNANQQSSSIENSTMNKYLKGYTPLDDAAMQRASVFASPIANLIGTLTGAVMMIASAAMFLTTALDLMYIAVPFMRNYLAPGVNTQGGGGAMGMGGMGMGGMGMGMGGMQQQQSAQKTFISDEAISAVQEASGGGGQQGMAMGGMPGGYGGGMPQQQQQGGHKSAIKIYLIRRSVFIVLFAVCSVVLMSSMFTDCGLNLAALLEKIMNKVNGSVSEIQIN